MKCTDSKQEQFYGFESWGKAIFHEIHAPEWFVYVDYFSDAEGNLSMDMPAPTTTNRFVALGESRTKLISRGVYESEEALQKVIAMGIEQGVTETWDRLAEHLEAIQSGN
jgi:uncharacterized protein YndB with AHSA1/START domain